MDVTQQAGDWCATGAGACKHQGVSEGIACAQQRPIHWQPQPLVRSLPHRS